MTPDTCLCGESLFDPSIIIASASAAIAICALCVSIWQGYTQRKHNKLSVTPSLTLDYFFSSDSDIKIKMVSCGLGPAVFKGYAWRFKGIEYPLNNHRDFEKLFEELQIDSHVIRFYCPEIGSFIPPGTKYDLFTVAETANTPQHKALRNILKDIEILLSYESSYGEEYIKGYSLKGVA